MESIQDDLYKTLLNAYRRRYRQLKLSILEHNVNLLWEYMKSVSKDDLDLGEKVENKVTGLLMDANANEADCTNSSSKMSPSSSQNANPGPSDTKALLPIPTDNKVSSSEILMTSDTSSDDSTLEPNHSSAPKKRPKVMCKIPLEALQESFIYLQKTYDATSTPHVEEQRVEKEVQLRKELRVDLEKFCCEKYTQNIKRSAADAVSTETEISLSEVLMSCNVTSASEGNSSLSRKKPRNSQKACNKRIAAMQKQLACLQRTYNSTPTDDIKEQIRLKTDQLQEECETLARLKHCADYQTKVRAMRKLSGNRIGRVSNVSRKKTKKNSQRNCGKVRKLLPKPEPALLRKTIMDIAMFFSGVAERNRLETTTNLEVLNNLQMELMSSATFLRVLSDNSKLQGGKKHITTVPVKLIETQNDHSIHIDSSFAAASIRYLESLASMVGPNEVFFLSQDHRTRVAVGTRAVNTQAPLLMRMEYKSMIPDHETDIPEKLKFIPYIYAGMCVRPGGNGEPNAVLYDGPTYIAIRTRTSSSSAASLHALDFENLIAMENFQPLAKTPEGTLKPVVIIKTNGGPNEHPRHEKVITCAINQFLEYNLDALFMVTDVPGGSSCDQVQRRLAPLNRELASILLPAKHFGVDLEVNEKSADCVIKPEHVANIGKVLAEVWSSLVIDDHAVKAEYIALDDIQDYPLNQGATWYEEHVQESEYFLQIVKCQSLDCCGQPRSSLRKILPTGFFPPPIRIAQTLNGLELAPETGETGTFADLLMRRALTLEPAVEDSSEIHYDFFCPSATKRLDCRPDERCKERPSRSAAKKARTLIYINRGADVGDEDTDDNLPKALEIIQDLDQWLTSPWMEDPARNLSA